MPSCTDVTVTATLSGALATGQGVYLRYTDDAYSTSTVIEMSGSGTTYTGTIPASINAPLANIDYYVFTSGDGLSISAGNEDWLGRWQLLIPTAVPDHLRDDLRRDAVLNGWVGSHGPAH